LTRMLPQRRATDRCHDDCRIDQASASGNPGAVQRVIG
jgi:hypothetical protein